MIVTLQRLRLRHFKGIRDLTLDFGGHSATIFGANGTGKTTVVDAWLWLLFGKESSGRKDFALKGVTPTGETVPHLDHEVEAILSCDGQPLTLKKVYSEKWTKKRGNPTAQFSGHTTDHFLDGVPVSEKDYTARIAELVDESVFRLLTSPTYFNERLSWQDRRALLLRICGDLTDAEVIAHDAALAPLPDLLAGRSLDDHRKIVMARRMEINRELDRIPVRIDEATRALPPEPPEDPDTLAQRMADAQWAVETAESDRQDIVNGGAMAQARARLHEAEAAVQVAVRSFQHRMADAEAEALNALSPLKTRVANLTWDQNQSAKEAQAIEAELQRLTRDLALKRELWHAIAAETFSPPEGSGVCPACGQAIPESALVEVRAEAEAAFLADRSARLEGVQQAGRQLRETYATRATELERLRERQSDIARDLATAQAELDACRNAMPTDRLSLAEDATYRSAMATQHTAEADLARIQTDSAGALAEADSRLRTARDRLRTLETQAGQRRQRIQGLQRIADLQAQEKALAAEFERLEEHLYLADQFVRTKVDLLTARINSKFPTVRFCLFDTQINGALSETCVTTYQGVPYSDLNHAAQIVSGIEICRVLSAHYGFVAPIFLDGRESVSTVPDTDAQVISLMVSPQDQILRVDIREIERTVI